MSEDFKPVPLQGPSANPWLWQLRLFFDLQTLTIRNFLAPRLGEINGKVLDVGAGLSPWRSFLGAQANYVGLDLQSSQFNIPRQTNTVYFDGHKFPFLDGNFDTALCTEVIEHVEDPAPLLREIHRTLKPKGILFLTCPFSARNHYTPKDFHRFTKSGLSLLLEKNGFEVELLQARGNDITSIANKLIVLSVRTKLLGLFYLPITLVFLVLAHASLRWNMGGQDDPLGYSVMARKKTIDN